VKAERTTIASALTMPRRGWSGLVEARPLCAKPRACDQPVVTFDDVRRMGLALVNVEEGTS